MSDFSKDLAQQAAATANRLRQIQADFADDEANTRQSYLEDEVQRILSGLMPDKRERFLDALREHFPTWDANVVQASVSENKTSVSQSTTDRREWRDVNFVLERLIELAADLPNDQKQRLVRQLAGAGLADAEGTTCPPAVMDELKKCLQMEAVHPVDAGRLMEMAVRLSSFTQSLDQLVWQIWKNVAPRSKLRGSGLQKVMRQFVKGDSDVPLTRDLEQLRHVVASLLSAISQIGHQFGQNHLAKFAPTEIEAAAATEPGGFLVAKEIKCWRKYTQLAKTMDDPAAIDNQIKEIIANFVESMPGLAK